MDGNIFNGLFKFSLFQHGKKNVLLNIKIVLRTENSKARLGNTNTNTSNNNTSINN